MAVVATDARVAECRRWAERYRAWGYQPLPSDPERKKPLCRFADWWETPAPADLFGRFETTNVQVMTGRFWNLAVVDLDGPEAVARFDTSWARQLPRTWTVFHSRGGKQSRHHWFSLPAGLPETRKRVVWAEWDDAANGWAKHRAIELLCDRSLIMAPPSVHPKTGNSYGFLAGYSPRDIARPAVLPMWFLRLPAVEPPAHARPTPPPVVAPAPPVRLAGRRASLQHVLDAIPDKASVARDLWGLRFARSAAESDGWVSVHDWNREDANPSCRFHIETGGFWRPGERVIPFCKIPVEMGLFTTWEEVAADLSGRFNIK